MLLLLWFGQINLRDIIEEDSYSDKMKLKYESVE